MIGVFKSSNQEGLFHAVLSELRRLSYDDDLLKPDFAFSDWFRPQAPGRSIEAAAFGQTPVSYDTACFGVAVANGESGAPLVGKFRALGAPIIFEIGESEVVQWAVGPNDKTTAPQYRFGQASIRSHFDRFATVWTPREFLRSKAIGGSHLAFQYSLFAGLIPELESHIQEHLHPMLHNAVLAATKEFRRETGGSANETSLFRLIFALLTGKVFKDRRHPDFVDLRFESGPDEIISRVAQHYNVGWSALLTASARDVALEAIWNRMDFQNLSVDVLSHIWANSLVTDSLRKLAGIHRTPRSIVRYIVDRLPFEDIPEDQRCVVELCCGSAVFLVASLNRLRDLLSPAMAADARHNYFKAMLTGFEREAAGVEISRLCLALADYPNSNGWRVLPSDVFSADDVQESLGAARIILCNPPYEDFAVEDRMQYGRPMLHPPLEVLRLAMTYRHPDSVLGFVLPRVFVDGQGYKSIRRDIVSAFSKIEIVTLPDTGWEHADKETVLLLATDPNRKRPANVLHRKVRDGEWNAFDWFHAVSSEGSATKTPEESIETLAVPELGDVWHYLRFNPVLEDHAVAHRGIEWKEKLTRRGKETGWREILVQNAEFQDSKIGIPPRVKFYAFGIPPTAYLDASKKYRKGNAHDYDWHRPKVVVNALTKSRSQWRLAATPDFSGLWIYQNLTAIWPNDPGDVVLYSAILNGPVANAFVATREGKLHIKNKTIDRIPLPHIDGPQRSEVERLVDEYRSLSSFMNAAYEQQAISILKRIDAIILLGYNLPPRLERSVLDFFNNSKPRAVPFLFPPYFPPDFTPCFSLHEFISEDFVQGTVGALKADFEQPQGVIREVLDHSA